MVRRCRADPTDRGAAEDPIAGLQSGTNPLHRQRDHHPVGTEGASGADVLEAVKRGKVWVDMQRIDPTQPRSDELGKQLEFELKIEGAPRSSCLDQSGALLFVSWPAAMVSLHADYQSNILWHLRGNETIWIYPTYDSARF